MGNAVKKVTKDHIKTLYSIKEKLGEGNFAVVHKCVRKADRREVSGCVCCALCLHAVQFAVKIIKKSHLKTEELNLLHDEHHIMMKVCPRCALSCPRPLMITHTHNLSIH